MFVLVKETGEYSSMDYTPVGVFKTLESAEYYATICEYEASILDKIATLRMERRDVPRFEIVEVPEISVDLNTSVEVERARLDSLYQTDLQSATEWRAAYDQKKTNEAIQHKIVETERQRTEVYAFIEWWNAGSVGDAFFDEKKKARFREIKKDLQSYLLNTGDDTVIAWMRKNNLSMSV